MSTSEPPRLESAVAQPQLSFGGEHSRDALYELTIGVAEGRVDKSAIATELERVAKTSAGE
jgi:hypothetical protein